MVVTTSLAETIRERLATETGLEMPATLDEYFAVLDELEGEPFTILFNQGILTATMSQASEPHEIIVANLIYLLNTLYRDDETTRVMGSSRIVYVPDCNRSFNPDVLVVKGPTELFPRNRKMATTLNPSLIIEVLSDSTEGTDYSDKLPCYKSLPSVGHMVFVHQFQPYATVFMPTETKNQWLNTDSHGLKAVLRLGTLELPLKEIYRKIAFSEPLKEKTP